MTCPSVPPGTVLVLCLGNPIRSDDAVGLAVASALEVAPPEGAVVRRSGVSGPHLLDEVEGFDSLVVVDAQEGSGRPPGDLAVFDLGAEAAPPSSWGHGAGLAEVLSRSRTSGCAVPSRAWVVSVAIADGQTVGEGLSPAVLAAVPRAAFEVRLLVERLRDVPR